MVHITYASSLIKDKRSIDKYNGYCNVKVVNGMKCQQIKNNVKNLLFLLIMVIIFVNTYVDYCLHFITEENT